MSSRRPSHEPASGGSALILATRNAHKLGELAGLLAPRRIDPLPPTVVLPPETGSTFVENALGKARAAAGATGRVVVADDSGLCADALDGRPGVRSARFAGEDATDEENLARLIGLVPAGSVLAFVCVIALVDPRSGAEHTEYGRCGGRMSSAPRGSHGFGYDPVFLPDGVADGRTMAELNPQEKARVSHRGRAAEGLRSWLATADGGRLTAG